MAIEFRRMGLSFEREFNMKVYYWGEEVGERPVDFFVEGKISVELKAVIKLDNSNLAQTKNYLEANNLEVGLLLNFGAISLEFKRIGNAKFKDNSISA